MKRGTMATTSIPAPHPGGLGTLATQSGAVPVETAFESLLDPAFALAQAMLRDRAEAEDAVQEAFLRAWRKRAQFRDLGAGPRP